MLSIQLQALEADGLIKREVFGEKPPLRERYEMPWNQWHTFRTWAAAAAFLLALLAMVFDGDQK